MKENIEVVLHLEKGKEFGSGTNDNGGVIGGYSKQDSLVKITRDFNKSINKLKNKGEIR